MERRKHGVVRTLVVLAFATSTISAQEQSRGDTIAAGAQTVATVVVATSRDPRGRIEGFTDPSGRQFVVTYDPTGHVFSVTSPDRANRADLPQISYAADGRLVSAQLGDGNIISFSYDDSGVQYVQDRYGALIRRKRAGDGYVIFSEEDPSARLRGMVERLDALLNTLSATSGDH